MRYYDVVPYRDQHFPALVGLIHELLNAEKGNGDWLKTLKRETKEEGEDS